MKDLKKLKKWDQERQELWKEFNLIVNPQKTTILTKSRVGTQITITGESKAVYEWRTIFSHRLHIIKDDNNELVANIRDDALPKFDEITKNKKNLKIQIHPPKFFEGAKGHIYPIE